MKILTLVTKVLRLIYAKYRLGLWHISRKLMKSVTLATKQGRFTLSLDVDDPISRSLYIHRQYELDLVETAMNFVRSYSHRTKGSGTVLDIGANNGIISIGMIVTGEVEKAIAIEPEPRNFAALKHNVAQNHLERVITCLNYAVSDSQSLLQFEISENNYGDHRVRKSSSGLEAKELFEESKRPVISVEANTLDNLLTDLDEKLYKDIAIVWIDVQGYEGYVFLGSKKLLASGIPVVSEIWPYGIQRAGMSPEEFCRIVQETWSAYWVKRRGKFVKYPTSVFNSYIEELGFDGDFDNVIFTQ